MRNARDSETQQLKLSESKFKTVLRDSNDAVIVHDFGGRILAWNHGAEKILEALEADALGRNISEFIPEAKREKARIATTRLHGGVKVTPLETQRLAKDGRIVDIWQVASALRDEKGTPYAVMTTGRDITAAKARERALRNSDRELERRVDERTADLEQVSADLRGEKELLRITLASIGDAVMTTDLGGHITYLNRVAERLTGWSDAEVRGVPSPQIFRIIDEASGEPAVDPVQRAMQDGDVKWLPKPTLLIGRDGHELAIDDSSAPIHDNDGVTVGAVLIFRDVTEKRRAAEQLAHQAMHDSLTGLVNRREFMYRLTRILGEQHSEQNHALLYMDLDQFKIINDSCGHMAGDELLRQLSALMLANVRGRDTLARLGGDEFGLLLENCPMERALHIAHKVRQSVLDFRFGWRDKRFTLGVSIGAVPMVSGDSLASLMSAADNACYAAKELGRNRVHVYQPDAAALALRHGEMQWTSRIKVAFAEERFRLYYQPIVALQSSAAKFCCDY